MGNFDGFTVHDLRAIVEKDDLAAMGTQATGWHGMAWLFDSQLQRLDQATTALRAMWKSPAADRFFEEIAKIRETLSDATDKANSNHQAWSAIAKTAEATRGKIQQIHDEYTTAWGKAQSDFEAAKKKDADNMNWAWGGLADLWDDPEAPKENAVRQPFDQRARTAMDGANSTYTTEYTQRLWWPPEYNGPTDAQEPPRFNIGGPRGARTAGGGGVGGPAPRRAVPPGGDGPHLPPPPAREIGESNGPGLSNTPPTLLPRPVPPVPPPTLPPPVAPPGLPPIVPPPLPTPPVLPPGRVTPPTLPPRGAPRPPLVPEIPETQPVVGQRGPLRPGVRPPGEPGEPRPVVGNRRGAQPSGIREPGIGEPGVRGPGTRGPGLQPGVREPSVRGPGLRGPATPGEPAGRPGVVEGPERAGGASRPNLGVADEVVGNRTAGRTAGSGGGPSGRGTAGGPSGRGTAGGSSRSARVAGEDGVVRSGAQANRSGGVGGRGSRRPDKRADERVHDEPAAFVEEELCGVDEAVPEVVEAPAPVDFRSQPSGPSVAGRRRRR